jgi:hypothetical protein
MKSLTLQIASLPDRENTVSEIWFGNDQVAEVSNEGDGTALIEIFPAPTGGVWSFDLNAFQEILAEAKGNLQKE